MSEVRINRDKIKDLSIGAICELIESGTISKDQLCPNFISEIRRLQKLIGSGEPIPKDINGRVRPRVGGAGF